SGSCPKIVHKLRTQTKSLERCAPRVPARAPPADPWLDRTSRKIASEKIVLAGLHDGAVYVGNVLLRNGPVRSRRCEAERWCEGNDGLSGDIRHDEFSVLCLDYSPLSDGQVVVGIAIGPHLQRESIKLPCGKPPALS